MKYVYLLVKIYQQCLQYIQISRSIRSSQKRRVYIIECLQTKLEQKRDRKYEIT